MIARDRTPLAFARYPLPSAVTYYLRLGSRCISLRVARSGPWFDLSLEAS